MLIVRNALHNVVRNKGRNALIILIIAIITAAAAVALAIVQAAERARTSALDDTTISAQISIDHSAMIGKARDTQSGGVDMQSMREAMTSKQLTLADYQKYDKTAYGVASSYYTETASAAAVDDGIEPVGSNATVTSQEDQSIGDTFKVADITDDTTTYTFTIVGIYRNTAENTMPTGGPMAPPQMTPRTRSTPRCPRSIHWA